MRHPELTLFFDGNCPFCAAEMRRLGDWDTAGNLAFVDIAIPGFSLDLPGVDMQALDRELHSLTATGRVLVGIDSMLAAYTLVGRGWLVAPLRILMLRPLLSGLYRRFARNRYQISSWLGYTQKPACSAGVCRKDNPFL